MVNRQETFGEGSIHKYRRQKINKDFLKYRKLVE